MLDLPTRVLDNEILVFIAEHRTQPSYDSEFERLAFKIFDYQFKRNKAYRRFCFLEGKSPDQMKSWHHIPAMPTAGFKELTLTTFPLKETVKTFKTSGTSQNHRGAHLFNTLSLYEAAILPPFTEYLLPDHAPLNYFFLTHPPEELENSSLSHMMGVVNKNFAKSKGKFYVHKDVINHDELFYDLSVCSKPAFILSTAFSLKSFLDYLKSKRLKLDLPEGSRLMETGGFKGKTKEISKSKLYDQCRERLGIDKNYCVSEYGMTELSSQFYSSRLKSKFLRSKSKDCLMGPAWIRTLVIDPQTGSQARRGAVGLLRHFDLANRGSVLAIQTEDLGRQVGEGFELLGRATGAQLRGCSLSYEEFLKSE